MLNRGGVTGITWEAIYIHIHTHTHTHTHTCTEVQTLVLGELIGNAEVKRELGREANLSEAPWNQEHWNEPSSREY